MELGAIRISNIIISVPFKRLEAGNWKPKVLPLVFLSEHMSLKCLHLCLSMVLVRRYLSFWSIIAGELFSLLLDDSAQQGCQPQRCHEDTLAMLTYNWCLFSDC